MESDNADALAAAPTDILPPKFEEIVRREVSKGTFFTKDRLEEIAKKFDDKDRDKIVDYVKYLAHLARISSKRMRPKDYMTTPFPM